MFDRFSSFFEPYLFSYRYTVYAEKTRRRSDRGFSPVFSAVRYSQSPLWGHMYGATTYECALYTFQDIGIFLKILNCLQFIFNKVYVKHTHMYLCSSFIAILNFCAHNGAYTFCKTSKNLYKTCYNNSKTCWFRLLVKT